MMGGGVKNVAIGRKAETRLRSTLPNHVKVLGLVSAMEMT